MARGILLICLMSWYTLSGQTTIKTINNCFQLDSLLILYDSLKVIDKANLKSIYSEHHKQVNCSDKRKKLKYDIYRFNLFSAENKKEALRKLIDRADEIEFDEYSFKLRVNLQSYLKEDHEENKHIELVNYFRNNVTQSSDSIYLAYGLFNFANYINKQRNFSKSIPIYKEALEISIQNNINKTTVSCYNQLAFIFRQIGDIETALKYGNKAYARIEKSTSRWNQFIIRTNLSHWYLDKNMVDSSLYFIKEAEKINPDNYRILFQKASIYTSLNLLDSAIIVLNVLESKLQNNPDQFDNFYGKLGKAHELKGEFEIAQNYYKKAIDIGNTKENREDYENREKYSRGLLMCYLKSNDLPYSNELDSIRLFNEKTLEINTINEVSKAEIEYHTQLVGKENMILKKNDFLNQQKIKLRNLQLIFGSIITLLLAILFVVFITKNKRIKNLNISLDKKVELLNLKNKEMNHRSKGFLKLAINMLAEQRKTSARENVQQELLKSEARLMGLSTISKVLDGSEIKDQMFQKIATEIMEGISFMHKKHVSYKCNIEGIKLNHHATLSLSLILNELILNSIKYAFENIKNPEIFVELNMIKEEINFEYRDNGRGLDGQVYGSGEGASIISDFVEQLNGQVINEQSTNFTYKFKFSYLEHV